MFGSLGSENGQFHFPRGIAVTNQDKIVIADTGNGRIQVGFNTGKTSMKKQFFIQDLFVRFP